MSVEQGASYVSTFGPLLDAGGAFVTTAASNGSLTAAVFDPLNGDHSATAVFAYVGAGLYRVTVPLAADAATGLWAITVTWSDGVNPTQRFADSFDVVAAGALAPGVGPGVSTDPNATNTRRAIRRQVSDMLGDLRIATATASGSTTTFTDAARLAAPVNAYLGREILVTGGTAANLGQVRLVSASTTGGQLTVAALPSATAIGDEIELRNVRHQGWSADEIHRAINTALSDAWAGLWEPVQQTLAAAFAVGRPTLVLPAAYAFVFSVEWQDTLGFWHTIPPTTMTDEPGWVLIPGGLVQINGRWGCDADGAPIRITGYERFAPLTVDTDTTNVNAEWLRHQAAAYLLLQGRERLGDQSRTQLYLTYQSRADRLRDLLGGAPANGTQAVRP